MKKYIYIALVAGIFLSSGLSAAAQSNNPCNASTGNGNLGYCPLEPIKDFTLVGNGSAADVATLLKGLFRILFSLAALLAVTRLVIGGIMYMTSDVAGSKSQAKKWAMSSLYGLLILAGSYLILNTINPDLIKLNLTVPNVGKAVSPSSSTGGQTGTQGNTQGSNQGNTQGTGTTKITGFSSACNGFNGRGSGISLYLDGGSGVSAAQQTALLQKCTNECHSHGGSIKATGNGTDSIGNAYDYQCVGAR